MDIKPTVSDNDRRMIIFDLVERALEYNSRNLETYADVDYVGVVDCVKVNIMNRKDYTVIASAYVYFGKVHPILAETLIADFETAKNLLK